MVLYKRCLKFCSFSLLAAKTLQPLFEGGMTSLVLRTRSGESTCLVTKTVVTIGAFLWIADLFLVLVKALNFWSCILCVRGDWFRKFCTCNGLKSRAPVQNPTFIKWSHGSMWLVFSKSVTKIKTHWVVQEAQLQEFEDLSNKKSEQRTFYRECYLSHQAWLPKIACYGCHCCLQILCHLLLMILFACSVPDRLPSKCGPCSFFNVGNEFGRMGFNGELLYNTCS